MRSLEADCSTSVQQQSMSSTSVQRLKLGGHSELGAFGTVGVRNWGHNRLVVDICCTQHSTVLIMSSLILQTIIR